MFAYQSGAELSDDYSIERDDNRDAIEGFANIARGLDQYGFALDPQRSSSFADILTISLGWIMLALVIFYPATQLAAIGATIIFFACRTVWRAIMGRAAVRTSSGPIRPSQADQAHLNSPDDAFRSERRPAAAAQHPPSRSDKSDLSYPTAAACPKSDALNRCGSRGLSRRSLRNYRRPIEALT